MFEQHIELVRRFLRNRLSPEATDTDGLSCDIDYAVDDHDAFVIRSYSHEDGVECLHLKYLGDGNCVADIDRDFFSLYGMLSVAQQQYIERRITSDAIIFWILAGEANMLGPAARIRIDGDRVTKIIAEYERMVAEQAASAREHDWPNAP